MEVILQVKTPTLMLLGAKDLRVPITDGLQVCAFLSVFFLGGGGRKIRLTRQS